MYITLLLLGEMATQYPVAGQYDLQKLHEPASASAVLCPLPVRFTELSSPLRIRFVQRIRDPLLFTRLWLRALLELLV